MDSFNILNTQYASSLTYVRNNNNNNNNNRLDLYFI